MAHLCLSDDRVESIGVTALKTGGQMARIGLERGPLLLQEIGRERKDGRLSHEGDGTVERGDGPEREGDDERDQLEFRAAAPLGAGFRATLGHGEALFGREGR